VIFGAEENCLEFRLQPVPLLRDRLKAELQTACRAVMRERKCMEFAFVFITEPTHESRDGF